jgi:hypothetical protein
MLDPRLGVGLEDTDPVLLEKTLERRTSGTTVRPKPRLSPYSLIGIATVPKDEVIEAPFRTRREEPEEELRIERLAPRKNQSRRYDPPYLARLIRVVTDGQQTSPTRSNVEIDQRKGTPVDPKLCQDHR